MYKLYNVRSWGSLAPHCVLEELDVPYQNIWMTPEQVRAPEYREIHPLGYIPALGLPDGRVVIESGAIVSFLVTAHADKGMCPTPGSLDYAEFLSRLHFMSTSLYPTINLTFPGGLYAADESHSAFIVEKAVARTDEIFGILENWLASEGPWLAGETFSAADIYLFMLTLWARPSEKLFLERFSGIARLSAGVRQRPRLKAVLEAHGVLDVGGYNG